MQGVREYRVPFSEGTCELTIKKSRFLGACFRAETEPAAGEILDRVRKESYTATHHCYAYRMGRTGASMRSSDDGEPAGTAGMPILNVLIKEDVTNVLCIVTRYFGGVLLGTGGLVRAYTAAAGEALKAAGICRMRLSGLYQACVPYPLWGLVERILRDQEAILEDTVFEQMVTVSFWTPSETGSALCAKIMDQTGGRVLPTCIREEMRGVNPRTT